MMFARLIGIAAFASALALCGCSPETRYRTLSFFFDGVPNPLPLPAAAEGKPEAQNTVIAGNNKVSSHGPYAAKLCEACHRSGGGGLILPVEELCIRCHTINMQKKHVHGPAASGECRICHNPHGTGKPFLLESEPRTFCFRCHNEVEIMAREVHQNTQGMICTDCHDPHSSDSDFMLK